MAPEFIVIGPDFISRTSIITTVIVDESEIRVYFNNDDAIETVTFKDNDTAKAWFSQIGTLLGA